jgi:hypothetical protein
MLVFESHMSSANGAFGRRDLQDNAGRGFLLGGLPTLVLHLAAVETHGSILNPLRILKHLGSYDQKRAAKQGTDQIEIVAGAIWQAPPHSISAAMTSPRRFPPPWSVEEQAARFVVRDRGGSDNSSKPRATFWVSSPRQYACGMASRSKE